MVESSDVSGIEVEPLRLWVDDEVVGCTSDSVPVEVESIEVVGAS